VSAFAGHFVSVFSGCFATAPFWRRHPDLNRGIRVLQTHALPLGYVAASARGDGISESGKWSGRRGSNSLPPPWQGGALPDELRPRIARPVGRAWCLRSESNQRHEDFQSSALPTELQRHVATEKGLEPSASSVTGWRSNQLNYSATCKIFGLSRQLLPETSGGNNRARTCDPMLVRHVLSQLSYAPPCAAGFRRRMLLY
jgi:hypothetical protein